VADDQVGRRNVDHMLGQPRTPFARIPVNGFEDGCDAPPVRAAPQQTREIGTLPADGQDVHREAAPDRQIQGADGEGADARAVTLRQQSRVHLIPGQKVQAVVRPLLVS
jgi:hypothetical protein